MTVKNYVLDINKTSLQHPSIVLRQDDYNIYTVDISVTENGVPVNLGSYSLNFLGITPAGAKIIDGDNFITTPADLAVGKFSYRFPKEAAGSKGIYDVAYFRLKTTSGSTSTIDLNLRVLGGIDLTADEVKDYITVDDTLRNTLVSEVFKKVDAKVDEHLSTVKKGDKGDPGPASGVTNLPDSGDLNTLTDTGKYYQTVNWKAKNWSNRPSNAPDVAFSVDVIGQYNKVLTTQVYYVHTTSRMWVRTMWLEGTTMKTSQWAELASDNNVAHKTGNEVIAGDKTFTSNTTLATTTILAGNYGLRVTQSGFQKTTDGKTWVSANI